MVLVVGFLLIGLDLFFIGSSLLAIAMSFLLLRSKVIAINTKHAAKQSLLKITPLRELQTQNGTDEDTLDLDGTIRRNNLAKNTRTWSVGNEETATSETVAIENEYDADEKFRKRKEKKEQLEQRRLTQLR